MMVTAFEGFKFVALYEEISKYNELPASNISDVAHNNNHHTPFTIVNHVIFRFMPFDGSITILVYTRNKTETAG